jgi:hypothetical protein
VVAPRGIRGAAHLPEPAEVGSGGGLLRGHVLVQFVDRRKMELDAEKRLRTGRRPMRRGEGVRVSGSLRRNY